MTAIHPSVYGAFQPSPTTVLLVASAASPAVAALLQRSFGTISRTSGRPLTVQDVVPLPASDSTGATTFSAIFGLILAGPAGTSLVYTFTRHRGEAVRIVATLVLAVTGDYLIANPLGCALYAPLFDSRTAAELGPVHVPRPGRPAVLPRMGGQR